MKIAVISSTVFSAPLANYGGLEQIAYYQATGLAAKGHEVYFISPDGSQCPGGTVVPTGPPGQHDEKSAFRVYKDLLQKVDCVVDNSWQKHAYLLKMHGSLKAPVLGVCHAPVNTMMASLPPGLEKPCFVCISQDQADHFKALYGKPAKVAYNGIDTQMYQSIGVPRTDRFLFVARFSHIKGALVGIQACKEVGVGLDLIGDTSITNEPEYLEQCKSLCDGTKIKLIGPATRAETVFWYSQAHAFIHPATYYREPFGMAPVEAQCVNLPVIAFDYGALRETVQHGTTGLLATSYQEFVEYVRKLANHISQDTRKACREWAQRFSLENMVLSYQRLAEEAVFGGGW